MLHSKWTILAIIMWTMAISGCAGSPFALHGMSSDSLKDTKVSDQQIIDALAYARSIWTEPYDKEVLAEAKRRGLLTDQDILDMQSNTIRTGMKKHVLLAMLGHPRSRSRHSSGQSFMHLGKYSQTVVMFQDDRVVSWTINN